MPSCAGAVLRAVTCCICVLWSPAAFSCYWWVGGVSITSLNRFNLTSLSFPLVPRLHKCNGIYVTWRIFFSLLLMSMIFFQRHMKHSLGQQNMLIFIPLPQEWNNLCLWRLHNFPIVWFKVGHCWVVRDVNVIQDYSAGIFRQLIWDFFPVYCLVLTLQWILWLN